MGFGGGELNPVGPKVLCITGEVRRWIQYDNAVKNIFNIPVKPAKFNQPGQGSGCTHLSIIKLHI